MFSLRNIFFHESFTQAWKKLHLLPTKISETLDDNNYLFLFIFKRLDANKNKQTEK